MLNHGGNLVKARQLYPGAEQPWLDLSTGISPWVWPVPTIANDCWQRLPEQTPAFKQAVAEYYGAPDLIPVAGSQQAIEIIPTLLPVAKVAVPLWGYGEHLKSWQKAGHELHYYRSYHELLTLLSAVDHAVLINPNNPTGEYWAYDQVIELQQKIRGYLVVDEAFIDSLAVPSLLNQADSESLIVMRSMGKFFGLAGIRLGFVALPQVLQQPFMQRQLLWAISTPTLHIAELALQDKGWHKIQRQRIAAMRNSMLQLLQQHFAAQALVAGPLFITLKGEYSTLETYHQYFAERGIWLRLFAANQYGESYLRFGFPETLARFERVLGSVQDEKYRV